MRGLMMIHRGHTVALLLVLALALLLAACGKETTSPTLPATATSAPRDPANPTPLDTATTAPRDTATTATSSTASAAGVINVVAAENFYGDMVQQIGGSHVSVESILSDPNIDPHEYESNVQNGVAVTNARMVIKSGGGYDDWMDKLLSASPNPDRVVITTYDLAPTKLNENEHVFYGIDNARVIAQAIDDALKKQDSTNAATFDSNLQTFDAALDQVNQKIAEIKAKYNGANVGLTETIFLYQSGPLGLKVLTPFEFEKAIAEGNDPPADTVTTANDQITNKQIKVLIYNAQTVTPVTDNLKAAAQAQHIPIVPVTETMPSGKHYQTWMLDQLNALEQALAQ